MNPQIPND